MNVLSLFDGISCGRLALERAGKKVTKYYASETNNHTIKISRKNYPDIIQLGPVEQIMYAGGTIEVQRNSGSWLTVDSVNLDLLIGGSPCQGFSIAGGGLNFSDKKSILFFEYIRILKEIKRKNPNIKFLLENVKMKKEWRDIITGILGVEPVLINSALVSAQNRERYYWTNICKISQPEDRGVKFIDILQYDIADKYFHSEAAINYMNRTVKGGRNHWDFSHHSDTNKDKSACITANFKKGVPYNVLIDRNSVRQLNPYQGCSTDQPKMQHRIYDSSGKAPALTSFSGRLTIYPDKEDLIRKLTPIECERLQTLPDDYTSSATDGHRYEALGNGWTVDVIAHIFKNL